MNDAPQYFTYDAERSVMVPRRPNLADKTYVDGEEYRLSVIEKRSEASHRAYFAELHSAWLNLPDDRAEQFINENHFRKWLLIKTGYCDERQIVCSTKAEAERIGAFVRSMSPYTLVTVKDRIVTAYEAKSQSYRSMSRAEFNKSKQAVLEYASSLIGVTHAELAENAGTAA